MPSAVKKTISLPADLAREAEETARAEGKTLSAVVQDALRTARRVRLQGELGKYALDLGNGYLLHGTTDQRSIGTATTHGCIRLPDEELEWLYRHIPVGATVHVR